VGSRYFVLLGGFGAAEEAMKHMDSTHGPVKRGVFYAEADGVRGAVELDREVDMEGIESAAKAVEYRLEDALAELHRLQLLIAEVKRKVER